MNLPADLVGELMRQNAKYGEKRTMIIGKLTEKIPWLRTDDPLSIPNDLEVESTELHFNDRNELDYLVFRVTEREGSREYQGYRAVRLLQLRYISLEARRDAGLLQRCVRSCVVCMALKWI